MVLSSEFCSSSELLIDSSQADIALSINSADTKKGTQLNVQGAGKASGTDLITYKYAAAENAYFILKRAGEE